MKKLKEHSASVTVYLSLSLSFFVFMIFTFLRIGIIGNEKQRFELASNLALNSALGEYSKELYERFDLLYIDASYLGKEPSADNVCERIYYYLSENAEKIFLKSNAPWGRIKINNVLINGFECATSGNLRNMVLQALMYVEDSAHLNSLIDEVGQALGNAIDVSALDGSDSLSEFEGYKTAVDGIPLPKKKDEKGRWIEVPVSNPADWVYGLAGSDIGFLTDMGNISVSSSSVDTSTLISCRGALNRAGIKESYHFNDTNFGVYEADKFGCFLNEREDGVLALQMEYIACGNNNDYENFSEVCERIFKWRLADNLSLAFADGGIVSEAYAIASELEVSTLNPAFIAPVADSIVASCAYLETISDLHCLLTGGSVPVRKSSHNMNVSNVLNGNKYFVSSSEGLSYRQYLECMLFLEPLEERLLKDMDLIEMEVRKNTSNSNFCMDYCIEEIDVTMIGKGTGIKNYELKRRYGYF